VDDTQTPDFPPEDRAQIEGAVATAFSPHSPISSLQLFRGRTDQIRSVVDAANIPGLHIAIYGERGVGKTSLANMNRDILGTSQMATSKVICAERDTFESVIRRSLDNLNYSAPKPAAAGFATDTPDETRRRLVRGSEYAGRHLDPDSVAAVLTELHVPSVLFIDEFDRLAADETRRLCRLHKVVVGPRGQRHRRHRRHRRRSRGHQCSHPRA
jgi:Cdc6-like AAA superfamily ATPase